MCCKSFIGISNGHSCKQVPFRNWFAVLPRFVHLSLPLPRYRRPLLCSLALVSGALNRYHFFHGSTSQLAPLPYKLFNREATLAPSSLVRVEDPTGLLVFEAALYSPCSCRGIMTSYVFLGTDDRCCKREHAEDSRLGGSRGREGRGFERTIDMEGSYRASSVSKQHRRGICRLGTSGVRLLTLLGVTRNALWTRCDFSQSIHD